VLQAHLRRPEARRTDGITTNRYSLRDYERAIDDLERDRTVPKVVIVP
jgi:hypothetical protein